MVTSATEAETGDRPASEPEIVALNASVVARMRARAIGASVPIPSEAPAARNGKRTSLGLAPGAGSSEPAADEPAAFVSGAPSVGAGLSEATLQRPASMADVVTAADTAIAIGCDGEDVLRRKVSELRGEVSELKAALIEARHEIRELKLIQESLRISTRGESGRDGARGVPGRDGQQGPIGPRGERGDRGAPAPRLATWNIDEDRFIATPVFGDGSTGAPLNLLPLFQSYDQAVSQIEDHDLVEAAHEARVENERQIEASRWAK
jgi:hypothetical protein